MADARTPVARWARIALLVGLCACLLPMLLRGHVIFHPGDARVFCFPEEYLHQQGNHASWTALWNPHVQLGRPAFHYFGLSQAYWLTHLALELTRNVWSSYTAAVLATVALGAFFAWSLFRDLDLHPAVSAAAALGFALCAFHGHSGYELHYPSSSVWTMGALWSVWRLLKRPSPGNGVVFAFVLHSLLVSGFPQFVVYSAWFLGGAVVLGLRSLPGWSERRRSLSALAAFGLLGGASALFVHLDTFLMALTSPRTELSDVFYNPGFTGWRHALDLGQELFDPLWFERTQDGALVAGAAWTPFFGAGVLLAVLCLRSQLVRYLAGFVLVLLAMAQFPALHLFAVHHLGLSFSRANPLAASVVPVFVLAALGLDRSFRAPGAGARGVAAALLPVLVGVIALLDVTRSGSGGVHPSSVALSLGFSAAALWTVLRPSVAVLYLAALAAAFHYGADALPTAKRAHVRSQLEPSPLAQEVLRRTPGGARFAWVGTLPPRELPPNTEQLCGLNSLQSYDSLSPRRYRDWLDSWTPNGIDEWGIRFRYIEGSASLLSDEFARSGVRVVLSSQPLDSPVLRTAGRVGKVHLYETIEPRALEAWLPARDFVLEGEGRARTRPAADRPATGLVRRAGPDERIAFELEARPEAGLLWLSQQYHPQWRASGSAGPLETVLVDDFWQGVLVPPGTSAVLLEFRPWARWAWIPQVFFGLAGVVALVAWGRRRVGGGVRTA